MENLWESLLKECSANNSASNKFPTSSILVFGEEQNEKSKFVNSLIVSNSNPTNDEQIYDQKFVEYQHLTTEEGAVVNFWSFDPAVWGNQPENMDYFQTICASETV